MEGRRPVPFSHSHYGKNIKLSVDGLSAERVNSYRAAIVVSSEPLENNFMYQVEITRCIGKWSGCIKIGVSGRDPGEICSWIRAADPNNDKSGETVVLSMTEGKPCFCAEGSETIIQDCALDLNSLREGGTVGVLCTATSCLQFYCNGKLVAQKMGKLPRPLYALVDLYGPITQVKVIPPPIDTGPTLQISKLPVGAPNVHIDCQYFQTCRRVVHALGIAAVYFCWSPKYCKCYCPSCYADTEPKVKWKGQPREEYAVPVGWAKFGLHIPPRAEAMDVLHKWHMCYHGTGVDNARPILQCGGLMIRGDKTLPEYSPVPSPPSHFHDFYRPEGFNTHQIFLSPSLHYCTHGEVYAGSKRCLDIVFGKVYSAKAAFQLRVHPNAYTISQQTTQDTGKKIDAHIPNNKLEWSTDYKCSTILSALLIKLHDTH